MSKRVKTATAPLEIGDLLCFAVYSAGHAFSRVYKPLLDPLGLTYPQYLALTALWAEDNQTVGGLGNRLLLESNTLTPLLKRLEANGYVVRHRDEADERQVRVRLTARGHELRAETLDIPRCILQATGLSAAELERLRADVAALRDSLLGADDAQ
jgi:DNA-binding MarR family transcriptional regulator